MLRENGDRFLRRQKYGYLFCELSFATDMARGDELSTVSGDMGAHAVGDARGNLDAE